MNYKKLTVPELRSLLKRKGYRGYTTLTKEQLIKVIESYRRKKLKRYDYRELSYKYSNPVDMHRAYERMGEKVRRFAVKNHIKAFDDETQVIIYDVNWLNRLKVEEIKQCRTMK